MLYAVSDFWLDGFLFNRETTDYVMLIKNTVSLLQHMVPLEAVLETIKLFSPIILREPSSLASESEAIPIFPSPLACSPSHSPLLPGSYGPSV